MFALVLWVALLVTTTVSQNFNALNSIHANYNSAQQQLRNKVTIDITPSGPQFTGEGTSCTVYARSGGYTGIVYGTASIGHGAWGEQFDIRVLPSIKSIYYPLYLWTTCGDAMLIDWIAMTDSMRRQIKWFWNDKYAICLSSEENDHAGFNRISQNAGGYNMVYDQKCFQTYKFLSNGNVLAWPGWTPGRRALDGEDLPTTEDVRACEQDDEKTEADCIALVSKILDYEDGHPEGWQLEIVNAEVDHVDPSEEAGVEPMLAAAVPRTVVGTDSSWLVNVFAAVGLCFTLFGAFRHYTQK